MFALFNPPLKKGRKAKYNSWFGDPQRHAAAARKGWAKRKRKHGSKLKRASRLITPGGGRIFSVAANPRKRHFPVRRNTFMGINPLNKPHGGSTMSRRRGGRRARFNMGSMKGALDAFKVRNVVGVMPILAGVIVDGLATKMLSEKIPYTRRGLGNIVLGAALAGVTGVVGQLVTRSKSIGQGLFVGGMVGTLGCAFQSFMQDGLRSLSLGEMNPNPFTSYSFQGMEGLDNFTTPQAIAAAINSESPISQYSLPNVNAQFVAPPQTPAQGMAARRMADYEGGAIGAVLGQDESTGMM